MRRLAIKSLMLLAPALAASTLTVGLVLLIIGASPAILAELCDSRRQGLLGVAGIVGMWSMLINDALARGLLWPDLARRIGFIELELTDELGGNPISWRQKAFVYPLFIAAFALLLGVELR